MQRSTYVTLPLLTLNTRYAQDKWYDHVQYLSSLFASLHTDSLADVYRGVQAVQNGVTRGPCYNQEIHLSLLETCF